MVKQWLMKVDDRLPALEVGSVNGDEVTIFGKRRRSYTAVMPRESGATATYVLKPVR